MTAWWAWLGRNTASLRVRLAAMLSLAVLPLGIIAVVQTSVVIEDARELEERNLLAQTLTAVRTERAVLRRAYGAADALGATAIAVGAASTACNDTFQTFVDTETAFVFAGVITMDGVMRCSSSGNVVDFSDFPDWQAFEANPRPRVSVSGDGAVSGRSVIVASVPVHLPDGTLLGAVSVSVPHDLTDGLLGAETQAAHLALVDRTGMILSASTGVESAERFEQLNLVPGDMDLTSGGTTLRYDTPEGVSKIAAVAPLIDDRIYVLGLWEVDQVAYAAPLLGQTAPVFPILMWIATLVVAILAVDRLVLRHLSRLGRKMMRFSADDPSKSFAILKDAPAEIETIAERYNSLIDAILADRAELQESVQEKELLLREVHHRVKNNLQLIASILNMQIRTVSDGSSKQVLRRVQDRVMSLSAIHKALYTGSALSTVRADKLLNELVQGILSIGVPAGSGIRTTVELDQLELDPDQAVPLALLANELITNAIKYVGRPQDAHPHITVRLQVQQGHITFSVSNSTGLRAETDFTDEGTGLGSRLIDAFVGQLGGEMNVSAEADHAYQVQVSFKTLGQALDGNDATEDTDEQDFAEAS